MKMYKLIVVCLLTLWSGLTQAQTAKTGALLWKISGKGLMQPSYIFGTHHAMPHTFLDSVPGVKQAFANAQQLIGELDLDNTMAMAAQMQQAGMMPSDTTWEQLLDADDYQLVDAKLTTQMGAGLSFLKLFKPSMLSMTYLMNYYQSAYKLGENAIVLDQWFQMEAQKNKVPIIALETAEDQINALFGHASLKEQAASFVCLLKNESYLMKSTRDLDSFYRKGDLVNLSKLGSHKDDPCLSNAVQDAAINEDRNAKWLEKLPALFADKSAFVTVGCLHLVGEKGLLVQLEKMGYMVEPVLK